MEQAIIDQTIKALERNHFEVYFANNRQEARDISTGILSEIEQRPECILIRTFQDGYSRAQKTYWRRQALLADLFVTGTNALTRQGQLVNVDMVGNRVAGITFGPEHVVLFIGTNKITDNIEQAMERIRTTAAPLNAIRHPHLHTPCQTTRTCMNCQSSDRLCNTWTITEKSLPQKRIKIILINESLGL